MEESRDKQIVQQVFDASLSGIQDDPWMAQRVLANVKGEKTMKKKWTVKVLLFTALMTITAVAFAATSGAGMSDFLGKIVGGWHVNEEAIVAPVIQSNTSQWLKLSATEAYWAQDGLSVVLKVDASDDRHIVCYGNEQGLLDEEGNISDQIEIGGQVIGLDQWRGEKELIVTHYHPQGEGWTWYERTDEGLFVIITSCDPDAEALEKGTDVAFSVLSENIQTGEMEESTVTVSLPAMTMQEGHR